MGVCSDRSCKVGFKLKDIVKKIAIVIGILVTSIIAGTVLLCLAYMLPTSGIKNHVKNDLELLQEEGNYTVFWEGTFVRMHPWNITAETFFLNNRGMARDNYTDAIMLGNAVYEDDSEGILEKALAVYRYAENENAPIEGLYSYLEKGKTVQKIAYPRYWHGYLVALKPLLCIFSYSQIKILNIILQIGLLIILCKEIGKQLGIKYNICFLGALLMFFPFVIPFCMQYSTAIYVMLISSIIYLRHFEYWSQSNRCLYLFVITGVATSYVDFLTYPIITLGILLVFDTLKAERGIWYIVQYSFMWCTGYFGMWAGKWIIATVVTGENVIGDGIEQTIFRVSSATDTMPDNKISVLKAVFANISSMTNIYYIAVFFILVGFLMMVIKKQGGYEIKMVVKEKNFLWIALYPFIWFAVIKNHSYDHSSFTYRALFVTIFALMAMIVRSCETIDRFDSNYIDKK